MVEVAVNMSCNMLRPVDLQQRNFSGRRADGLMAA